MLVLFGGCICAIWLQALVDKKKIVISEDVIREILRLDDAEGVVYLPNEEIFAGLAQMGYEKQSTKLTFYKAFFYSQWKFLIHTILQSLSAKRTSWNEFSTAMASAVICLSKGQRFNFSRVEGLETANTAQQLEIIKLKARVKKLESLNKERVNVDIDEGIKPVVDQEKDAEIEGRQADTQAEIYNIDLDHSSKVLSMQEDDAEVQEAVEIVTTAKLMTEYARKLQEEEESHVQAKDVQAKDVQAKWIQYIRRYHRYKKKPQSESEARKNMIAYLKNTKGFKMAFIKGKTYDQIRLIFQARFDANMRFLLKSKEEMEKEEEEIIKSINETPAQKAAKRRRLREQAKEVEDLKKQLEVVVDEDDDEELEKEHEEAYKQIDWNAAFNHVQAKETQYIKRYHGFKKKPQSESEARKNMISYLKNTEGFKMEFFKGKTYDQILPIFQARFDANIKFLFKTREEMGKEDEEIIKSINETPAQKAAKRRKLSE
nr:hypothetical protein [Tanacetum cinerariifolium]